MKLSTTEIGAVFVTALLVGLAAWMASRVPEPATPEPIELAEVEPTPTPKVHRPEAPTAPVAVPDEAFREVQPGLQVAVLRPGTGAPAAAGSVAVVAFALWTADGTLIDTSHGRSRAFRYTVGARQVIPGWELALGQIAPGGALQARISPELGFGPGGQPDQVAPGTALVLDLELIGVEAPRSPPESMPTAPDAAWKTLDEGVTAADLDVGTGQIAAAGLTAHFDFTIWLPDGSRADSSLSRRAPVKTPLGEHRIVRGFEIGLIGMQPGGRRLLRVPAALAYGEEGRGDQIPPGTDLLVELRLSSLAAPAAE